MARLFPFRSEPSTEPGQPRVVDLEGEDADAVFSALSSTTARQIYARLDEQPGTPSDVADAIDSSIQNVRYHLENLEDAGLVEIVDTWYSSRGNEMSVYATTDGPLIVTSDESAASQLKTALSRLIGGIGALAGGSLLVQYGLTRWFGPAGTESGPDWTTGVGDTEDDAAGNGAAGGDAASDDAAGDDVATDGGDEADDFSTTAEDDLDSGEAPEQDAADVDDGGAADYVSENGAEATDYVADGTAETADAVFSSVPPGLLFFLGGLVVLLGISLYWYWSRPTY